ESGTIGRVEMVNFMCHPYLRIDLGPKVNFVIGHNGSGKSAILTAITVALGAKANSTNRGKKLSSLIREGANAALVTVHITNKGPDAYRHDVFGDTIIVERKILKDGVGNYRIKTLSGKVVSTKREELTALLDHMVIQVDNQLVILTQDMAREFLNSSSPNEKYKLFMRGTQLAELAEDYAIVRETLDTMGTILKRKEQSLPDLQRRAKEAFQRFETVKTLSTVEDRLEELSNELSWSQVIAKEKEEKAEIASLERAKASDVRDINTRVQSYKATIKNFEKKIAEHTAREANSQSIRSSLELQLEELGEEKIEKEEELNKSRNEFDRLENDKIRHINNKQNAIRSMDIAQKKIDQQRNNITELQSLKSNRLRAYGQYVPEVLEDIEKETRWRRKPVGPLGRYVKLKYQEYRDTMEIVLGRYLNAFLVEHTEDRRLLMSILERRRMRDTMVLVASYDLFDFSSGEPDEQYLTVLRALEFEDEWVKRQLIIGLNIEKILLIAERAKADEVMKNGGPANVKSCFTAQAQRVGSARGKRVEALNKYTGPQRFKQEIDSDIRYIVCVEGRRIILVSFVTSLTITY
ncbi:P-loop containing nucleoside triphosphate hydrolase protein, partial [Phascolomyces articulosus]